MHDAAVSGVKISYCRIAGAENFFDPFTSLLGNFVGTLFFVVGNVYIDARDFGVAIAQRC